MNLFRSKIFKIQSPVFRPFSVSCCLFLAVFSFAASFLYAEHLPVKTYTVADGLLRDEVNLIKQDSRGFLWLCTAEGVSRFDGYNFTNFTAADGLPDGKVNDFLETNGGDYLFATDKGLAKLNPTGLRGSAANPLFTNILPDNKSANLIQVLFQDKVGEIFAGTSDGLYRLDSQNQLELINLSEMKTETKPIFVTAIVEDRRGALWVGTRSGDLFRLDAGRKIARFTVENNPSGDGIAALYEDRDGNLWAGMRGFGRAGLLLINPQTDEGPSIVRRTFTVTDGLPSSWISAIYQANDGQMWLGTTQGLCQWQSEKAKSVCRTYTKENDLCGKDVFSVNEDQDGNLWTGSRCGAKKLARYGFTSYGEADGIETAAINSIFENRSGELFATVIDKGTRLIYRFGADGKFTEAAPHFSGVKNYLGWGWKQTVWQDSGGAWLVPTNIGLFRFAPETSFENLARSVPQKFSPTTQNAEIFRAFEDSRGDVWIATWANNQQGELWRWRRGANVWEDFTSQIARATNSIVTSFVEDKSGNLWIGTGADNDGAELIRYREGNFKVFTEADGLPGGWIRDLYVDGKNRLWLANNKVGVLRFDDVNDDKLNFTRYSKADGLSSAGAYCVTEDAFDRIYIGSARGVDRLNPDTGQVENFSTADGLPSSFVEEAFRDKNNNLWFGTHGGLTKYVPEPKRERHPPTLVITGLRVNGEPQAVSVLGEMQIPNTDLNSQQRQVSVDFTGLGASLGENLKYEYRLGNADWTQTNERTVNFANLGSGNYKFEIRAVTADRIYSAPASISFRIAAPLYLRWWFILLTAICVALIIVGIYRYRLNKLLEIERTRTRIASDLHDDIGTNLSKISLLSEIVNLQLAEQNTESNKLLHSIAEISRESVGSMADIVWAINPKRDSVSELVSRMRLHAEESFLDRNVRVKFDAPEAFAQTKLSMDARREIYLIFKEAINNAAKYSDGTKIEINFRLEGGTILLEIADDGRGFDVLQKTDGNGLENMRKRAEKNGGKFEIESEIGHGTILRIRFPQN